MSEIGLVTCNGPDDRAGAALAARRAEALAVDSLGNIQRVSELARAVGVSVRTLHRGFHQVRGCSPSVALRRARLWRARRDLLTRGDRERVSDAAMRWGFCHLGRFSACYAAYFGELPSETRRRSAARELKQPSAQASGGNSAEAHA